MPWCRSCFRRNSETFPRTLIKEKLLEYSHLKVNSLQQVKLLKIQAEILKSNKGIMVNIKKVFMEPETYPKMWK